MHYKNGREAKNGDKVIDPSNDQWREMQRLMEVRKNDESRPIGERLAASMLYSLAVNRLMGINS